MRGVVKTANKLDTVWSAMVLLPAVFVALNAGINAYQGKGDGAAFSEATGQVVTQFVDQYSAPVKATGGFIATGTQKLTSSITACAGGKGPVYTKPGLAYNKSCFLGNKVSFGKKIKAYRY